MLLLTKSANKTPWKLIITTEAFSSLANQFMQILLPWYILSTTGSVLWTGFVGFCSLLPNVFSSLFGAQVIDRFGRSKVMFGCEVCQLILIGDIPSFYGDIFYNRFSQLNVDANNRVSLSSITDLNDSTVDSVALMYTSDKNAIYVNIAFKTRTITISLVK